MRTIMRRTTAALALAAVGAALPAGTLAAQSDTTRISVDTIAFAGPRTIFNIVAARRARLGIKVNLQARQTDSIGAYVEGVTPGGPADRAGIRSGDVITRIDGVSLTDPIRVQGPASGRSLPGLRLIEHSARLQPSDTVPVELRRGTGWKERKTVRLVTGDEPTGLVQFMPSEGERGFAFGFGPGERARIEAGRALEGGPGGEWTWFDRIVGSPLGRLELAPLNPDLGRYFGTDDGVLVISAPTDTKLQLRGGDVVLAVDGRKPSSPSHLLRILRSYDAGEQIKLDVMRNHRRETITATVDDPGAAGATFRRNVIAPTERARERR